MPTIQEKLEEVQSDYNSMYNIVNEMTKIKLKCWLQHSQSRVNNNNPPFEFETIARVLCKNDYLDRINYGMIDCNDLGGKEMAIEIVERWYS